MMSSMLSSTCSSKCAKIAMPPRPLSPRVRVCVRCKRRLCGNIQQTRQQVWNSGNFGMFSQGLNEYDEYEKWSSQLHDLELRCCVPLRYPFVSKIVTQESD